MNKLPSFGAWKPMRLLIVTLVAAAAAAVSLPAASQAARGEVSRSLPEASISMNSPATFKIGRHGTIYPKVKIYVGSNFGSQSEPDLIYANAMVINAKTGATVVDQGLVRVYANRTLTFQTDAISKPGRFYFKFFFGQIRESSDTCPPSSPDGGCNVKVANLPGRKFFFTVKK